LLNALGRACHAVQPVRDKLCVSGFNGGCEVKKLPLAIAGLLATLAMAGCATTPTPTSQSRVAESGTPTVDCHMKFSLTGWSLFYERADGVGNVSCDNGQSMPVKITVKGGGLTAGKWHIDNGKGSFTDVHTITDVLGSYAQGGAHAGVVKSASAQVLTKGPVSLALSGTGQGVDLGVGVGKFTISRR
jgi:hypothetical protein